jgi:hypothetical protein
MTRQLDMTWVRKSGKRLHSIGRWAQEACHLG